MRKRIVEFLVLAMLALGAGPVGAAIWQWSTTPGNNATADPSINWSEGMSPSSVNDSARAMMAAIAAWRNDISAVNTTAGTSTAYTLTTSEGLNTTPSSGQMISFIAHATNGDNATLQVDAGNTYPLWINGVPVTAGTLVIGTPYRVAFSSANSAWLLEAGYGNPYSTALGGLMPSTAPTAPNSNFLEPAGQCISTTTYAAYWAQQGSPASGACPGGQFAVIDLRGRIPVPLDTLNGSPANRLTSASNGCGTAMTTIGSVCANGTENKTLSTSNLPPYTPAGTTSGTVVVSGQLSSAATGGGAGFNYYGTSGSTSSAGLGGSFNNAVLTGTPQGGTSTPFASVQPTIGVKYYLRVI